MTEVDNEAITEDKVNGQEAIVPKVATPKASEWDYFDGKENCSNKGSVDWVGS